MKITIIFVLALITFVGNAAINKDALIDVYKKYRSGAYKDALKELTKLEKNKGLKSKTHYWKGLCYTKLQDYESANKNFAKAVKSKKRPDDLFYQYGQSLYASQELNKARKYFYKSSKQGHMAESSEYYIGYISQILEQYDLSKKFYHKIGQSKADENIIQASQMQLGEVLIKIHEKKHGKISKDFVKNIALPQFEKAKLVSRDSALAKDIQARIYELKKKHELDGYRMKNGRKLPEKRYKMRLLQEMTHDTNVTLESDSTNVTAVDKDSLISSTTVNGSYRFDFVRRFSVIPKFEITSDKYFESDTPTIYQNDAYTLTPSVKNRYEHSYNGSPARLELELSHAYEAQDQNQNKKREFYSRTTTTAISERLTYFPIGSSTLKFKYKMASLYDKTQDYDTFTVSWIQMLKFPKGNTAIATVNVDLKDAETSTNSTNSYYLRGDYLGFEIWNKFKVEGSAAITILDTKQQSSTRGTEVTYNPTLKFSRKFFNLYDTSLGYSFTKATSDSASNEYTKHEYFIEVDISL